MDEFWVCPHCRSLNRAGSGKCYSCKEKYGSRPKDAGSISQAAPVAPVVPPPPPAAIPDFGRQSPSTAPYFSRPVALAPASRPGAAPMTAPSAQHNFNPYTAIKRRISRSLAMRPVVSVSWLGYLTAVLIALVLAIGTLIGMTVTPAAFDLLQHADVGSAWAQLPVGRQGLFEELLVVFVAVGAVTLLCFSVFVGLMTHNATGLGAEQPMLTPYQAGTCWAGVLWTQVRIVVGLTVPAALLWRGYELPGLIAALVALEIAHRHLDGGDDSISRTYKHLPDLYAKLGVEGSISSPMAWTWSGCFRIANAMIIAVSAIPIAAFVLFVAAASTERGDILSWQSSGLGTGQIIAALLVACLAGWSAVSVALLIPITVGFVHRQRTRKTLVRVGRSRSWVGRPGEGGAYATSQGSQTGPAGAYDEDRIVERVPSYGVEPVAPEPSGRGAGTALFGGARTSGPVVGGAGQGAPAAPGFGGPTIGGEPRIDDPRFGGLRRGAPADPGFGGPGGPSGPGFGGPGFGGSNQGDPL